MGYIVSDSKKITTKRIREMKQTGEKIAVLTSYDYTIASLVEQGGVDMIHVGDSASNVMQGNYTTVPITIDDMIVYGRTVARACRRAMTCIDMPFGTYQGDPYEAQRNAVKLIQQTGIDSVKVEGGEEIAPAIELIIRSGIPVFGHLGLTPQSVYQFGSFAVRAQEEAEAKKLLNDAKQLEQLGCFAIVLEKIPADLARRVTESVAIPTVGIGAGPHCDGQVLVVQDMLGMNMGFSPKFLRRYNNLGEQIIESVGNYVSDVKAGTYPNEQEQY
ncbi:MAG: 3-methyl-2-oxobutanoate hydroxymethyltransferase [Muribaculaceae bacterium]|nr:3-methyl-2-oxobutanoate hydroxymethyltransferase [Muribaculaceae bacterium]